MENKKIIFIFALFFINIVFLSGCIGTEDILHENELEINDSIVLEEETYLEEDIFGETESYFKCINEECVLIAGEGTDECSTDEDCIEEVPTYFTCIGGFCVEVEGEGEDSCIDDSYCIAEVNIATFFIEEGTPGWNSCSSIYGGWNTVNQFCICEGYFGALADSENPCYIGFSGISYEWEYEDCGFIMGEQHIGGLAIRTVKCLI